VWCECAPCPVETRPLGSGLGGAFCVTFQRRGRGVFAALWVSFGSPLQGVTDRGVGWVVPFLSLGVSGGGRGVVFAFCYSFC